MPGCCPACFNQKCLFCVPLPNGCCIIVWFHMIMSLVDGMGCVAEFREAALRGAFPLVTINSSIALHFHASAAVIEFMLASLLIVGFIGNNQLFLLMYLTMVLVWAATLLAVGIAQVTDELPDSEHVTLAHQILIFVLFLLVAVSYVYFAWVAVMLQKYVKDARAVRDEEMRQFVADLSDRRRLARITRVQAPRKSFRLSELDARATLSQSMYPTRRPSTSLAERHGASEIEMPSHVLYMSETGTRASDSFSEDSLASVFSKTSLRENIARASAPRDKRDSTSRLRQLESEKSSRWQDHAKSERRLDEAGPSTREWPGELHSTLESLKTQEGFGSSARVPSKLSASRWGSAEQDLKAQELEIIEEALQTTRGGEPMWPLPEVDEERRSSRAAEETPRTEDPSRALPAAPTDAAIGPKPAVDFPIEEKKKLAEEIRKWPQSEQPTRVHSPPSRRSLPPAPGSASRGHAPKHENVTWVKKKAESRKANVDDKEASIEKPVSEEAEKQKASKNTRDQETSNESNSGDSHSQEWKVILSALPPSDSHDSTDVSELWKAESSKDELSPENAGTEETQSVVEEELKVLPGPSEEKPVAIHSWPWRESLNERIKTLSKERELQKSTSFHRGPEQSPKSELKATTSGKTVSLLEGPAEEVKSQKSLGRWNSEEERLASLRSMKRKEPMPPQRVVEAKRPRGEVSERRNARKREKHVRDGNLPELEALPGPSRPHRDGRSKSPKRSEATQKEKEEDRVPEGLSSTAAKSKATSRKSEASAARAVAKKQDTTKKPRPRRIPTYPRRSDSESDSRSSVPVSSSSSLFSSTSSLSSDSSYFRGAEKPTR